MKKTVVENLYIVSTGFCSGGCEVCLRGSPVNSEISDSTLDKLLSQIDAAEVITYSGGEPFERKEALKRTMNAIERHKVTTKIHGLWTNGWFYDKEIEEIFERAEENYNFDGKSRNLKRGGIYLSQDKFHRDRLDSLKEGHPEKYQKYKEAIDLLKTSDFYLPSPRIELPTLYLEGNVIKNEAKIRLENPDIKIIPTPIRGMSVKEYDNCFVIPYMAVNFDGIVTESSVSFDRMQEFDYGNVHDAEPLVKQLEYTAYTQGRLSSKVPYDYQFASRNY